MSWEWRELHSMRYRLQHAREPGSVEFMDERRRPGVRLRKRHQKKSEAAGDIEFSDENGGGLGIRLRKHTRKKCRATRSRA